MIISEITKHVGIDRIVAKRLRVLLQTDPAKPTVDVQVQSLGLLSAGDRDEQTPLMLRFRAVPVKPTET